VQLADHSVTILLLGVSKHLYDVCSSRPAPAAVELQDELSLPLF